MPYQLVFFINGKYSLKIFFLTQSYSQCPQLHSMIDVHILKCKKVMSTFKTKPKHTMLSNY